jgi:uncharacterized protein YndB with AHSA1/START domain
MTNANLDLEISRFVAAPRAKLWRAWEDPALFVQWWCPKPWKTELREFEFRTGGAFYTFMTGPEPEGGESDNPGIFLEVVPQQRIVWTSMLVRGWRPATPWLAMTGIFTFADDTQNGVTGTRYIARCLHRDDADRQRHKEMGFFEGWGTCMTQIEEVAQGL